MSGPSDLLDKFRKKLKQGGVKAVVQLWRRLKEVDVQGQGIISLG